MMKGLKQMEGRMGKLKGPLPFPPRSPFPNPEEVKAWRFIFD